MLVRHGLRAPLADEAAPGLARGPWPAWPVPGSHLTPHGAAAARLMGAYERADLAALGLIPAQGCPAPGQVMIWTNSVERTIHTGQAMAEGFAPGCDLSVGHLPQGERDALFDPFEAGAASVDGAQAVAAMAPDIADVRTAARDLAPALALVARALGCDLAAPVCDFARQPPVIRASADNKGVDLRGPVAQTAGAAQIFILQYLEGMDADQVAWGRLGRGDALATALATVSRLHGLQFDVFARNRYMAPRKAVALAPRLAQALSAPAGTAPVFTLLVGHDDNIAAIAGLLRTHFQVPGYGRDDPPVGGGLRLEVWRGDDGAAKVRVLYQAQTPEQVRALTPLSLDRPAATVALDVAGCAGPCPLETVTERLTPQG